MSGGTQRQNLYLKYSSQGSPVTQSTTLVFVTKKQNALDNMRSLERSHFPIRLLEDATQKKD